MSSADEEGARRNDEETPLLRTRNDRHEHITSKKKVVKETPLPWKQFGLVLFLQLAEPLTSQVIYPFLPEFIRDIGITNGDDKKIGYYAGTLQSVFFATQALTVLHWSRISDTVGRKPIILIGLFGLSISMYCFGLSQTYWGAVMSRSLNGALNGNIGIIKSMMAELTDDTNVARAFAYQPLAWSTGSTVGPLIGGALSRPAERWPSVFGNWEFFKTYPYFLACSIPATFSAFAWIVTYLYLKETNPTGFSIRDKLWKREKDGMMTPERSPTPNPRSDAPLHTLFTPKVVLSAGNYALLALVDICYRAIQPLFFAMPIHLGGLGLSPPTIGFSLAFLGLANGIFQALFFAGMNRRLGAKRFYMLGIFTTVPIFVLFPITNLLAKQREGVDWLVGSMVVLQLLLTVLLNTCYGSIFIYITAAAPNRRSLGATNGLAQTSVSVMRAIGPGLANSLFSISLEKGYLGGWLVYYVMLVLASGAIVGGLGLPAEVWKRSEQ